MTVSSNPNYSQDRIFNKFMEVYNIEELQKLFGGMLPDSPLTQLIDTNNIANKDEFCKDLLELIGDNFLYRLSDGDKGHLVYLRWSLIQQACIADNVEEQDVVDKYNETHTVQVDDLEQLCGSQYFHTVDNWKYFITEEFLDVPESVILTKKEPPQDEETSPLRKRSKLKPLHDYQYQSVNKILNMLSNKNSSEKAVFINLPTGSGKTRLTVEAIVEWINLRNQNKLDDAHEQQKNGKIIFWFASTIELCGQAADEFTRIFDSIGIGTQVYLTRLYGAGRRKLNDIINDYDGIHVVVTNTEHFIPELRSTFEKNKDKKYYVDKYHDDPYFEELRKKTVCVVVDEAHEITSKSHRRFLAAMGFDNSGTKESKINFSRNNVILIGLSATAYKGNGLEVFFECDDDNCGLMFNGSKQLNTHVKQSGHYSSLSDDDETSPEILKDFNEGTRTIFKMFQNNIFVPLPHEDMVISNPVAIIDVPSTSVVGEYVKFSGLDSFDRSSDLKFRWEIRKTSLMDQPIIKHDSYFSHPFKEPGHYTVKLKVTSLSDETKSNEQIITISVVDKGKCFQGTIEDNAKFYDILTKRGILCPITHGVIIGPRVEIDEDTKKAIKKNGYEEKSNKAIIQDIDYNKTILDLVKKCMTKYGREKILIFANSVEHATQLSQIIRINFNRDFKINSAVVTGNTRPGQRRKIIEDFKNGDVSVLVNFGVLTTGFDVPKIDTVIISRLVFSNSLMTQMIGRGQRGPTSRGSEDLWLFTSKFIENNSHIELGWESTAEQWSPFSKEIKDDLHVIESVHSKKTTNIIDSDTTTPSTSTITTSTIPKKDDSKFILDWDELKFQCTQCKRQVLGFEKIQSFFGLPFPSIAAFEASVKNRKFRTITKDAKCRFCRTQNNALVNIQCEFTNQFGQIHNFEYFNVLIAKYVLKNNQPVSYTEFVKIFDHLKIKQNQLNQIISKLDGILFSINNSIITFKTLSKPDALRTILTLIESQESYVENTEHLESCLSDDVETNSIETNSIETKLTDESQKFFFEISSVFGHYPTSRQFNKLIKFDQSESDFNSLYGGKYPLLLGDLKINIQDDVELQNILFDEFFEKCLIEKKDISYTELDECGQFNVDDYKEIFQSHANFIKLVHSVLQKVLSNPINDQISLKNILDDYSRICNLKGTNSPTFEVISMFSSIGIETYIQKQIPFSIIPILFQNLNKFPENQLELFLILLLDFFKLRNILGSLPTNDVFLRYMSTDTKKFYQNNFSNITEFFNQIGIDDNLDMFEKQKQRMNKFVIGNMDLMNADPTQKLRLEKIINHVNSNMIYDSKDLLKIEIESCIQIDNYIENKNSLNNYL